MRLRTGVLISALVPLLSGCATMRATMNGWSRGPDGLTKPQRELREALSRGDFPAALAWKEDDALLRVLTAGAATYYASQYARSAALLDTAALLSEERLTSSLSKNSLALVTNDLARPYQLRRTERLFVPYYGMLAYVQLGQWEEAAVEARRMVALLAQYEGDRAEDERALHASMHYLAGAVFERAGEAQPAAVAYRNAHALVASYPEHPAPLGVEEGDVLLVVERGFVAHRATESIHVRLGDDERHRLHGSDEDRRGIIERIAHRLAKPSAPTSSIALPAFAQKGVVGVPGTVAAPAAESAVADEPPRPHDWHDDDDDDDDDRNITLAFPALRRSPRPWAGLPRITRDSTDDLVAEPTLRVAASVDDASAADERRERAMVITRELARATARYAAVKAVRDKQGKVAGFFAGAGASLLEVADVRSWHLLPQEVVVMRVHLPAGAHRLAVAVGDGDSKREVDLGPVTVRPGMLTLVPARFWREPAPEWQRHRRCEFVVAPCPR